MKDVGRDDTQQTKYEQVKDDEHVTLTTVHDTQKTEGPMQSLSVSSDFANKFLNLDNVPPTDTEVISMMNVKSQIPAMMDAQLSTRLEDSIKKSFRSYTAEFEKKAKDERKRYTWILLKVCEKRLSKDEVKTYSLKRGREDKDKDEDPPAGSDQGLKKRKTSKDAEPSRGSKSKESKSSSSKGSKSQSKSSGKSAQAEEPSVLRCKTHRDVHVSGEDLGNTAINPNFEVALKDDWFRKPKRPPTPDSDWNTTKIIDFKPPQTWINKIAKVGKPPTTFDEMMSTPIDFSVYVLNNLKIENLTQEYLVRPAFNLLKGTCKSRVELEYHFKECYKAVTTKATQYDLSSIEDMVPNIWSPVKVAYDKHALWVTRVEVMRKHGYGYLRETEVQRADNDLYTFKEGDFPRLRINDIEDMLLLVVQNRLTNLSGNDVSDFAIALRVFTRSMVIQKRVEDLQLGVESY
ncbi:hypothetical protein Tco_0778228 [Tanacetum coccineum]